MKLFEDAEYFLQRANSLSDEKDHTVLHMLGMRYRAELSDKLQARRDSKDDMLSKELDARIEYLAEQAAHFFELSIEQQAEDEHGYVSYMQTLCALIEDTISNVIKAGGTRNGALTRDDIQHWLKKAHELINSVEIQVPASNISEFFGKAKGKVIGIEGDIDKVIHFYKISLERGAYRDTIIEDALARTLFVRGQKLRGENTAEEIWRNDFDEGARHLTKMLEKTPYDSGRINLWFRCARFSSFVSQQELIQRLEDLWGLSKTLEAAFYLSCLYFVRGIQYQSLPDFERSEHFRIGSKMFQSRT